MMRFPVLRVYKYTEPIFWLPKRVTSLSVHVNFGTKGGQYRYMTTLVHMGSISVHVIFAVQFRYIVVSISVHEQ